MLIFDMLIRILSLLIMVILAGCVVGPDYRTPILDTPATWKNQVPAGTKNEVGEAVQLSQWWNTLNDPFLTRLAEEAVSNNLDLKQAQARLRESRARRSVAAADRYPTLKGGLTNSVNRSSGKTGTGDSRASDSYSAQLDVGLDMDLFGGNKRALESATATLEASEENVRDVQVSLMAEVVLTYIDIRSSQTQILNTRNTIVSLQESSQITRWRSQAGLVSQLDEEQARMNLEQTQAQLPTLLNKLEQARNNLALLLGRSTGSMDELPDSASIPFARAEIAIGVPAETLRQRPDIRRAERQLAVATAQVGKAESARYPNFSLSGTIGMQSESLGNLLNPGAFMYSLASNAVQTIFDGGRLKQQVEIQNALQEQALITYKSAVRSALRDVENALSAYAGEQNRRRFLTAAVDAARNAVALSTSQYAAGLVDYSTVLDSQRSLLSNQDQLIQSEAAVTSNLVRLYKALGGGWTQVSGEPAATRITSLGEKR